MEKGRARKGTALDQNQKREMEPKGAANSSTLFCSLSHPWLLGSAFLYAQGDHYKIVFQTSHVSAKEWISDWKNELFLGDAIRSVSSKNRIFTHKIEY